MQRWFIPLYHPDVAPRDYSSAAWGSYFANPHVLDTLLPHVDVWQVWPDQAGKNVGGWWTNLRPILKASGKLISTPAGNVGNGSIGSASGTAAWAYDNANFVAPMVASSGGNAPDILVMDNAPAQALEPPYSISQSAAVTETVNYMVAAHASYPAMQIGLDVSMPHWTYQGQPDYWNAGGSGGVDYAVILPQIVSAAASAGVPVRFLQTDCPYDYAVGTHDPYHAGGFMSRLVALEHQARSLGIPFGPMLNSETAAITRGDPECYCAGLQFLDAYLAAGGNPDQLVTIWWWQQPNAMLPPETRYTVANIHMTLDSAIPRQEWRRNYVYADGRKGYMAVGDVVQGGTPGSVLYVGPSQLLSQTPQAWAPWTPTVGSTSGAITTASAAGRYLLQGKTLRFSLRITITTNGTGAGLVTFSLPLGLTAQANSPYQTFCGRDSGLTAKMLLGFAQANAGVAAVSMFDNTYPGGTGALLDLTGMIEVN